MWKQDYGHAWYIKNRERILAKQALPEVLAKRRAINRKIRQEVLQHYGGKCTCCGEGTWEFLAIDHVSGSGTQHRKQINRSAGSSFYAWLRKNNFPEGYQVLCHNCNNAKGFYGQCPHGEFDSK